MTLPKGATTTATLSLPLGLSLDPSETVSVTLSTGNTQITLDDGTSPGQSVTIILTADEGSFDVDITAAADATADASFDLVVTVTSDALETDDQYTDAPITFPAITGPTISGDTLSAYLAVPAW